MLDGQVYQAGVDGQVRPMSPRSKTPFVAVTHFDADQVLEPPPGQDLAAFQAWLGSVLPSRNIFYAIRVDGYFPSTRYRSVPRQAQPYPPLVEAASRQVFFERKEIEGTLIGLWCPAFTKGINVPGFHLHFLSADRQHGGHVLDFTLAAGRAQLDLTNGWEVRLHLAHHLGEPAVARQADAVAGARAVDADEKQGLAGIDASDPGAVDTDEAHCDTGARAMQVEKRLEELPTDSAEGQRTEQALREIDANRPPNFGEHPSCWTPSSLRRKVSSGHEAH